MVKSTVTRKEDAFLAEGAKEFYQAAIAVHTFQKSVSKILREITDESNSDLTRLGLRFANAREKVGLDPNPFIQRRIYLGYLEAGLDLMWFDDDPEMDGKRLCVYWWIWLKELQKRDTLAMRLQKAVQQPFELELSSSKTCHVCFYFSFDQTSKIRDHTRKCTKEFVHLLNNCRDLLQNPMKRTKKAE